MESLDSAFEASFTRALGTEVNGKRFVDRFYERFLASDPEVARVFEHTPMARQKTMLHDSLHDMVEFARTSRVPRYLEQIAARHGAGDLGISERFYALWLGALLDTAAEFDSGFSAHVGDSWRQVLEPGISFMLGRR